jgi:hypothetical protein
MGSLHFVDLKLELKINTSFNEYHSVWMGRRKIWCRLNCSTISPFAGLEVRDFTVGRTALKVVSSKMAKHEKAYSANQRVFIPFAFDTFVFLGLEAVDLLKRVQMILHIAML